ncbi:MAG TPA: GNAT family N-acetyltransferase [Acetobacteraceae bacterium]|nr:GNAT family N-acetyltransferase [Acetobacteraceae bacterium]
MNVIEPSRAALILASPGHAAVLAAIHAAAFPPAEHWGEAAIATQLTLPGGFGLLHSAGGMALGRMAADEAEILALAVMPESRRNGLGRLLLTAAEAHVAAVGGRVVFLEVSCRNDAARALYGACGYREVGRRSRYYPDGTDALVLARPLRPAAATAG